MPPILVLGDRRALAWKRLWRWHLRRLTPRNIAGLVRYLLLRIRFRNLRVGLFFLDRGGSVRVGPSGRARFGRRVRMMRDFSCSLHGELVIGNDVYFARACTVSVHSTVTIGNDCLFGEHVSIHDENHELGDGTEPRASLGFVAAPITIGNNVWVGAKATILSGVSIGDNAVIGANAVVTRDVPANSIAVGIPARVVGTATPAPTPTAPVLRPALGHA